SPDSGERAATFSRGIGNARERLFYQGDRRGLAGVQFALQVQDGGQGRLRHGVAYPRSGDVRKNVESVLVADLAAQHRVVEFHLERRGGTDASDHRYGTASHADSGRHVAAFEAALNKVQRRLQRGERAFLVQLAGAVLDDPGAQDQLIPVVRHVV